MNSLIDKSIIQKLKEFTPDERPNLLTELYGKNREFFKQSMPEIDSFLNSQKCPYRIDITKQFLNIIHEPTGDLAHPAAGLDAFSIMMGDWVHNAWIDLFNFKVSNLPEYRIHSTPLMRMENYLVSNFPAYSHGMASRRLNLKVLNNGRRFSPPVIFLGIFHGLHVAHFLSKTDVPMALFIEPEPARFEVSCYFLDYEAIREKVNGQIFFAIGKYERAESIQQFFNILKITQNIWARVLPAYSFDNAPAFIENFKIFQTARSDIVFPLDLELKGMINGLKQIKNKRYLLSKIIRTSKQCKIVIVATGPSLTKDLQWLKKNQEKLIIFAVHSSVKILRKHNIIPDFQFSLDIEKKASDTLAQLELYEDVPFIMYYKADDAYFSLTHNSLMIVEKNKSNPVIFTAELEFTHPSTTCLAFSFAHYCNPEKIYLSGCDFGYRTLEKDHAAGSIYDRNNSKNPLNVNTSDYGKHIQAMMTPNFPKSDLLQTTTSLSCARNTIEALIEKGNWQGKVINMSDGIRILHTITQRSHQVQLPVYSQKQFDIDEIRMSFEKAELNKNWKPYSNAGSQMFFNIKKMFFEKLSLKQFSWISMTNALDNVLLEMDTFCKSNTDSRMEIYWRLFSDLLSLVYCCVLFHDSEEEAGQVYRLALAEMKKIVDSEVSWPIELDEILNE